MARSDDSTEPELFGINQFRLSGLSAEHAAGLLTARRTAPTVVERLVTDTAGNPLAILEAARQLAPEQLRGSAPLPSVLPVGQRLGAAFLADQAALSADGRWSSPRLPWIVLPAQWWPPCTPRISMPRQC